MSKVLLIEPDSVLARAYMQALEHSGHIVRHVSGAQEGIHAADDDMPEVVVLELQLNAHNGIEFLHEFRSYVEWQKIPVIINTYLRPSALAGVQKALVQDLGVSVCLYKPQTTLRQLVSLVNQQSANV